MRFLSFIVCVLCVGIGAGQDAYFGQFYANKVLLNPAFCGTMNSTDFVINHRRQWVGIQGGYSSSAASFDTYLSDFGGVGIVVTNDVAGNQSMKTNTIGVAYSYGVQLTRRSWIQAGFQAGLFQKSVDKSVHTYEDMINQNTGMVYATSENLQPFSLTNADFSAGGLWYSKKFYLSAAVYHLNRPDITFGNGTQRRLSMKYTLSGGAVIPLDQFKQAIELRPTVYFQRQGQAMFLSYGLYADFNQITIGTWYRHNESILFLAGYRLQRFSISYSYEYSTGGLRQSVSLGSHEISISYAIPKKAKRRKIRPIACPTPKF